MLRPGVWSDFDAPRWDREGIGWPHAERSRFVESGGIRWHVQEMGEGPVVLLLHGTGAATHSWRGLAPELARELRVIAPDLPGHGFTQPIPASRMTLPGLGEALRGLLETLAVEPELLIGHSAGAAISCQMIVDGAVAPRLWVSLNGAFFPFRGVANRVFSPVAKLFSRTSIAPLLVARRAREEASIERVIRGTGSSLDHEGAELYRRLVQRPSHVASALAMMANWDLESMKHDLRRVRVPALFITGAADRAVDPKESRRAARLVARGTFETTPGVGHLAHEELPVETAERILRAFRGIREQDEKGPRAPSSA